ncbi:ankyrin repeat domain-containing protein 13B isoform X2 [Pseudopipra pipra]|uniref:ankyrin repeat domain-containing protein 13B isoform X2 n=1 Tax=Pseudopipra pipra TaxID=415032 RepID=UPI003138973B
MLLLTWGAGPVGVGGAHRHRSRDSSGLAGCQAPGLAQTTAAPAAAPQGPGDPPSSRSAPAAARPRLRLRQGNTCARRSPRRRPPQPTSPAALPAPVEGGCRQLLPGNWAQPPPNPRGAGFSRACQLHQDVQSCVHCARGIRAPAAMPCPCSVPASGVQSSLTVPSCAGCWQPPPYGSGCREQEEAFEADIEQLDPRGRTPLHLATTLGHLECARVLLKHGADVGKENRSGWTVLQEAVSTRDLELVQLVLRYRDYQRAIKRLAGIPVLLEKLRKAQDFYVEMKWEFTSWVPLVSKICPSDTYKVWKSGQNLRVDTTLLGFDHMTWQRGNRSFVFRGQDTSAVVMEIDHDRRVVYSETLALAGHDQEVLLAAVQPTEEQVMGRLTAPVVTTQLDTKNIAFERNKSGILGWRSEKTEMVNGYEAKVYGASNVELITRTRTEHLSDQHKGKSKGCKTPLQSFLGIAEQHVGPNNGTLITQTLSHANPTAITPEEYFNPNFELGNRDMGRPMELTTKTQKFKAKLWLCEDHPLSLCEQVAPIIDLMAISNALFAKLRDFITLRLPPGFPVKIEIPIFHILNARITFGNLNGCDEPVSSLRHSPSSEAPSPSSDSSSVSSSSSLTSCRACEMDPALFEVPRGYSVVGTHQDALREDEDDLLQFAIQQSLLEAGSEYDQVTIWEALTNSKPGTHPMSHEGRRGDRTPQHTAAPRPPVAPSPGGGRGPSALFPSYAEQLRLAMALSAREQEEAERRTRQEEEDLQRILQLSLTEK